MFHNFLLMVPLFPLTMSTFLQSCREAQWVRYCVWKKRLWSCRETDSSCRLCRAASSAGASLTTAVPLETIPQKRYTCLFVVWWCWSNFAKWSNVVPWQTRRGFFFFTYVIWITKYIIVLYAYSNIVFSWRFFLQINVLFLSQNITPLPPWEA